MNKLTVVILVIAVMTAGSVYADRGGRGCPGGYVNPCSGEKEDCGDEDCIIKADAGQKQGNGQGKGKGYKMRRYFKRCAEADEKTGKRAQKGRKKASQTGKKA